MSTTYKLGQNLFTTGFVDAAPLNRHLLWLEAIAAGVLERRDTTGNGTTLGVVPTQVDGELWHIDGSQSFAGTDWEGQNDKLAMSINGAWDFFDIPDWTHWVDKQVSGSSGGDGGSSGVDFVIRDDSGSWIVLANNQT